MSRRKIRCPREETATGAGQSLFETATYPVWDARTGRVELVSYMWEIDRSDIPHVPAWREAHAMLPDTYRYDPYESRPLIASALRTLADADARRFQMLAAIALLGHSPCPEALRALDEVGRGGGAYAGVARLALCECAAMLGSPVFGSVAC